MDKELERYLAAVEGYLKNMPVSERIDVIMELKSSIEEMRQKESLGTREILERLGSPKELAAGYLGDRISTTGSFNIKKVKMLISFYTLTSLGGMFVIPCGAVFAGGMMLCGIIVPVAGLIKAVGYLAGFDVPFVVFNFGSFELHPLVAFACSVILGGLFFILGRAVWRAVVAYIRKISAARRALSDA